MTPEKKYIFGIYIKFGEYLLQEPGSNSPPLLRYNQIKVSAGPWAFQWAGQWGMALVFMRNSMCHKS